jgi:hypothetical protein
MLLAKTDYWPLITDYSYWQSERKRKSKPCQATLPELPIGSLPD